jgi:hypothetical protein
MRKGLSTVAVIAATAGMVLVGTASAMAEPSASTVVPLSKHTGTAGCFNWSWADGTLSTTVYFHNTCPFADTISIKWSQGHSVSGSIASDGKGNAKGAGSVTSITDKGPQ